MDGIKTVVELLLGLRDRRDDARRRKSLAGHVQPAVDRFKLLAKSHGLTLAQVSGLLPRELAVRLSQLTECNIESGRKCRKKGLHIDVYHDIPCLHGISYITRRVPARGSALLSAQELLSLELQDARAV